MSWSHRAKTALHPWLTWIVAVWCIGVAVCSLRPLLGCHMLWRLKRVGVSPASEEVLATLRRVAERLQLRRAVCVLHSTLAQVPVVVGYLRPVILLPVSLMTSLPAEQLEAILAHELAHVRRHDFVVNLLQTLVETFFFYHPAVWWLSHQIRVEREHCCDDLVVASFGNRVEYGRALLAIEELRGRSSVLALGAADGSLLSRIRRIVRSGPNRMEADGSTSQSGTAIGVISTVLALAAAFGVLATSHEPGRDGRLVATLADRLTVELVGVTKNGASATEGWHPEGGPLLDVEGWELPQQTIFERNSRGGVTLTGRSGSRVTATPMDEGRDLLVKIRGLKTQPSLRIDHLGQSMTNGWAQQPLADPYFNRLSFLPDPAAKRMSVRVGIADEPWGEWRRIDRDGKQLNPVDEADLHWASYRRIEFVRVGASPDEPPSDLVLKWPTNHYALFAFEIRAIDVDGKTHWIGPPSDISRGFRPQVNEVRFQLGSAIPFERLARFEYRLRPFRYWVTFEEVALQPHVKSRVVVKAETVREPRPNSYAAKLPNGVRVEFVGLAPMEKEPKTWWKPDGSPLSEVPKFGSEMLSVTGHDVRRAIIRVHGETVGYQDVTAPGMSSVLLAEPPGSGGPFIRISSGYAIPLGQKTGRFEVGIATQPQSPARYLNAKGQRVAFIRRANAGRPSETLVVDRIGPDQLTDINSLLGVSSLTRQRPGALLVDDVGGSEPATVEIGEVKTIADGVAEDIEVLSVAAPPLRQPITANVNGRPVLSPEVESDNKMLSQQTQITWRVPNVPKPMNLELVLIDVHGKQHPHTSLGTGIENVAPNGIPHWGDFERFFRFEVPISRVAGFEYRVRPYQHWVTFDNVALNPGEMTDVKVKVESQLPRPEPKPAPNESTNFEPIEGQVLDSVSGKPIAGATVRFRFRKMTSRPIRDEKPLAELVFRNVGKFTFELPDAVKGQTDLFVERFAEHPDYQSLGATGHGFYFLSKAEPNHARDFIRQVKMTPGKVVTGRVVDLNGQPAKGVAVTSGFNREGWQNGNSHNTTTDANGRYRMVVPESSGRGRIYVIPNHAAAVSRAITPEFGEQPVFQLQRGTRLFGRVTDAKGRGVANVVVRADGNDRVPQRYALTDADGRYSLPPCQYGQYVVQLYDEGRFPDLPKDGVRLPDVYLHQLVDLPKTALAEQQLDFKPTESVRMTARYTTSNDQPVSGRSLSVSGVADKVGWWGRLREASDQPGLYELRVPRNFLGRIDQNSDGGFLRITRKTADGQTAPERYVTKLDDTGVAFQVIRLKPSSVTLRPTFEGKPVKPTGSLNFPQFADPDAAQRIGARLPTSQARTPDGDKLWFDVHPDIDLLLKLEIPGFKPWHTTLQIAEGEDRVIDVALVSDKTPEPQPNVDSPAD